MGMMIRNMMVVMMMMRMLMMRRRRINDGGDIDNYKIYIAMHCRR